MDRAGLRAPIHNEERKVGEKPAVFSKPEKYSPGKEDMKSIAENKATKPLKDRHEAERITCASLNDSQTNSGTAWVKKEVFTFSKSHEKLHSLTDEEIAGMYSKVAKKYPRKEVLLPLRGRIPKETKMYSRSWSADNLNEEESEYEAIKSPHWHTGSRTPVNEPDYAFVNEKAWGRKWQSDEETEPGYEAINIKSKKTDFPPKRAKAQKFPPVRPTENYYESISELQQSRTHTRVLTCEDGKQLFVTGL
ncbi:uncharacterized protein LOC103190345 [Callorhinchus milii]|nr:uncharacterized protein LOC103190345 [Callorhinchus milii]